jgi:putative ABC transport system ATP-binding protein
MIELKNISKKYKTNSVETIALRNFSLIIHEEEFLAIMGSSGSGKTTLLNILGCMDTFDEGQYLFHNTNIKALSHKELAKFRNEHVGFIFQSYNLINDLTVFENIELPLGLAGIQKSVRKKRVLDLVERVGLSDKVNRFPKQLSGGQQQRVAIARALANNPKMILADEPTGNLDSNNGQEIMKVLSELNQQGIAIILVTHDKSISSYAKKCLFIKDGKIEQ